MRLSATSASPEQLPSLESTPHRNGANSRINSLQEVIKMVVEAARDSLVIGQTKAACRKSLPSPRDLIPISIPTQRSPTAAARCGSENTTGLSGSKTLPIVSIPKVPRSTKLASGITSRPATYRSRNWR